jgi:hypothetical protein
MVPTCFVHDAYCVPIVFGESVPTCSSHGVYKQCNKFYLVLTRFVHGVHGDYIVLACMHVGSYRADTTTWYGLYYMLLTCKLQGFYMLLTCCLHVGDIACTFFTWFLLVVFPW